MIELNRDARVESSPHIDVDHDLLQEIIHSQKPDVIIDCAGIKSHYYLKKKLESQDLKKTIDSYAQLIENAKVNKSNLIFISSGGAINKKIFLDPSKKDFQNNGFTVYGQVNYELEKLITESQNYLIIRGANVYGDYKLNCERQGLITEAFFAAIENRIIQIDNPLTVRDYIHVEDFVTILLKLIMKRISNEVINVGTGIGIETQDILKEIKEIVLEYGYNLEFEINQNSTYVSSSILDITKLLKIIDSYQFINIKEGLKKNWTQIIQKNLL